MHQADTDSADRQVPTYQTNTSEFTRRRQKQINLKDGWLRALPPQFQLNKVAIVGGGPSIDEFVETIKELRGEGMAVATMNGSHDWCLANGIYPDLMVLMDQRPHNAKFTRKPVPGCRYLISESVHRSVLEGLPKAHTYLWSGDEIEGGSTVMLCAPSLLRKFGAKEFHFFGFDSCYAAGKHHAYEQPENDADPVQEIMVHETTFLTTQWMIGQAEEFLHLAQNWGDVKVYGDGLIATLIREEAAED